MFGFTGVDSRWNSYPNVTDSGLASEVFRRRQGRPPSAEELTRFHEAYRAEFVRRAGPSDGAEIPGAGAFLARLRQEPGWRVAIATGNFRSLAVLKLERAGIGHAGVPTATADDGLSRADLVRLAIKRAEAGGGFSHVVSVGDAPWDLRTSRELGLPLVVVGDLCGGDPGCRIADYRDWETVLPQLAAARCW